MQRRIPLAALLLASAPVACGGETSKLTLTLGPTYDAVAALRFAPEGSVATTFVPLLLTFDALSDSGGRALGVVGAKGGSGAVPFTATFSSVTGDLVIEPFDAAFTATTSERIDELGGRADDILPRDGVADELTGFFRSRRGVGVHDGTMLATARTDRRPAPPDVDRIELREAGFAQVTVRGAPGAMIPAAGVEVFRFGLARRDPEVTLGQARDDGAFELTIDGLAEDLFLVRTRSIGTASDGRFLRLSD